MALKDKFEQATKITEEMESKYLKELQKAYSDAYKSSKDELYKMLDKLKDNKFTQEEMMKYNRLTNLVDNLQKEVRKAEDLQYYQLETYLKDAYEVNYYRTGYAIDDELNIKTGFSAIDRKQVTEAVRNPIRNMAKLDNTAQTKLAIKRTLTQSVVKGEGIQKTAQNLKKQLNISLNRAERIARTETTGIMSKARKEGFDRASQSGVTIQKEWVATLDGKTRDSHASLDGERVNRERSFSNGLMYPGDQSGPVEEVVNCRCTMVAYIPEYEQADDFESYEYQNYEEWAKENGI